MSLLSPAVLAESGVIAGNPELVELGDLHP
jgi:hypothetical protein